MTFIIVIAALILIVMCYGVVSDWRRWQEQRNWRHTKWRRKGRTEL